MPGVSSLENARGSYLNFHQNQLVLFYYVHFSICLHKLLLHPSFAHTPTFCPLAFSPYRMRSLWHFHFLSCQLRSLPCCEWDNPARWRLLLLTQRASCVLLHTAAFPATLFSGRPNLPDFDKFFLDPVRNTKWFSPKANFFCPFISYVPLTSYFIAINAIIQNNVRTWASFYCLA